MFCLLSEPTGRSQRCSINRFLECTNEKAFFVSFSPFVVQKEFQVNHQEHEGHKGRIERVGVQRARCWLARPPGSPA